MDRSPALEERLLQALGVDEETGAPFIRPEIPRVNKVVKKVAIGLFALRYGRVSHAREIGPVNLYPYQIRDDRPWPDFVATFNERFRSKPWRVVQRGVFSYIFVRDPKNNRKVLCVMDIYESFWGVVHFPNPKSAKALSGQLTFFQELGDT